MKIYAANTALVRTGTEEKLLAMLDEARREQIGRYKRVQDRERGICAGLLLRHSFLEQGHTEDEWKQIRVIRGTYGKPMLENYPDFHYSLSHSGDWVVCAVDMTPLGVDIQMMENTKLTLAKRFYHPEEYQRLIKIKEQELQKKEFYTMWTAKESYVKLTGRGIGEGINQYITEHTYQHMQDEAGFWLADIKIYETIADYIVCVCTREKTKAGQLEIVSGIQG